MNEKIMNLANEVSEFLGLEVEPTTVEKNNKTLTGLTIKAGKVSPVIYVDEDTTADKVIEIYKAQSIPDFDTQQFLDWETIKESVVPVLVNGQNNPYIKDKEWVSYIDLAITFKIVLDSFVLDSSADNTATVAIKPELLDKWDITTDELLSQALKNVQEDFKWLKIGEMLGMPDMPGPQMMVGTNKRNMWGATIMLFPYLFDFDQDMYLLPSSIHEIIAIPCEGDVDMLSDMISEINENVLNPTEKLSNHPYIWRKDTQTIISAIPTQQLAI